MFLNTGFVRWISLSLALSFILGCSPLLEERRNNAALRPLNAEQLDDFENLVESFGRIEESLRLVTNRDPSWGKQDPQTQALADLLRNSKCKAIFKETPSKRLGGQFNISLSGESCPAAALYEWRPISKEQPATFKMDWFGEDDSVRSLNEVVRLKGQAQGSRERESLPEGQRQTLRYRLEGSGLTSNGRVFRFFLDHSSDQFQTQKGTENRGQFRLLLQVWTDTRQFDYVLEGEWPGHEDENHYKLNTESISAEQFKSYFSRLGLLVGFTISTEAG